MSRADFTIPHDVPVCLLESSQAFKELTEKEKTYAHYLSRACCDGGLIVLLQTSPESPAIFLLLQRLFSLGVVSVKEGLKGLCDAVTDSDFQELLVYAASFYSNMGNYKHFGDTKIVPALNKEKFQRIIWASEAYKQNQTLMERLWNDVSDAIYCLKPRYRALGLGYEGVSTYYSSNIVKDDVVLVNEFMQELHLSPYNTRLFKSSNGQYQLCLASVAGSDEACPLPNKKKDKIYALLGNHTFKGKQITISRGDYDLLLRRVVKNLEKAMEYAANDDEVHMLEEYIFCFVTGSIEAHKDGSRFWIADKTPIIESYMGFIECYRDPYGVRGEFEGFVAMVNKEMSAKFRDLVVRAEELLPLLPWPAEYEKEKFSKPDFTSLDILTFAGSGIPTGINMPNYEDIRQKEGFKNVSLGNVLQAQTPDQRITFLAHEEQILYAKLRRSAFEVQVGLCELLGHGCGKLFQQNKDGTLNFDPDVVKHLETKEKISTWYKANETWESKFAALCSSYEACRAECVGLHLCLSRDILKMFGHEGEDANDVVYVNWLNMARAGVLALEFYSSKSGHWKQAHMQARFVILRVLLEAGGDLVKIEKVPGDDGLPDLVITLDRNKIETTGRQAIAGFLMRLQLYKATADVKNARKLFSKYSSVDADGGVDFIDLRSIVLARKQPRRLFVQAHTEIIGGSVEFTVFPATPSGLIESFQRRFPDFDSDLEQLWINERLHHSYETDSPEELDLP